VQQSWSRVATVGLCLALTVTACGNARQQAPAQASGGGTPEVLAVVEGKTITNDEVRKALGPALAKLEEQAYEMRKQQLEELIADRLVEAEAARRGVTVEALLEQEVNTRITPVTEPEVNAFVAANRNRIQGDPEGLKPQIRAFLANQRAGAQRQAFVETLRGKASVDVRLEPPPIFRADVAPIGASQGPATAPVTIVEFSDFHCPFCRAVKPTMAQVLAKYGDQVRHVYRHFPLDSIHPQARRAAEASWCADQQGKFWPYHDRLYAGGSDASPATLTRIATESGLDLAAFEACLAGDQARAAVQRDVEDGAEHGVSGTPGFFINGRFLSGNQPMQNFVAIIDEELKGARR
jgi:protein-disulfide isomerase